MSSRKRIEIHRLLKNKKTRLWFWIAVATFFLGAFLVLTSEMQEAARGQQELLGTIDKWPNQFLEDIRTRRLNTIAVDLTALGSTTVVTLFLFIASVLLILKRRFLSTLHLLVTGIGAAILTWALKSFFERPRPNGLAHLVDVQGYSYPSGHSLASAAVYFTFAVILCNAYQSWRHRAVIISLAFLYITCIAFSRVYLGVHYVSDIMAGMLIGIGWASLVGAVQTFFEPGNKRDL